jgi:hypothetical protein
MTVPEIEISKDGLKLSYQRYLADSAAGFVVILAVLFVVSMGYPLPFFGHSLESLMKLSDNVKVFIFLLLFLLAMPLGLLINGVSWFLFGWCQIYLIKIWFRFPEQWYSPFFPTKTAFQYTELAKFFQINDQYEIQGKSIYELSELFEDYLSLFSPEKIRSEHVNGLSHFFRSLAFLLFFSLFSLLHVMLWDRSIAFSFPIPFLLLLMGIFCTLLYSLMESFSCIKILSTIYLLCTARGISNEEGATPQELIRKIHDEYFREKR